MTLTKLLRRRYAPLIALVLVAGSWMVLQRLTMELSFPLGYDEAVYVSQTSYRPHVHWSAPRAYGLPLLMWPLVHFTASTVALRLYASILTALGLIAAYWPWTKVRAWSAVLATALFVTLWISSFYASLAMPNLFTALAAVASVGYLVWWLDQGSRVGIVACVVAVAVMTLVRPTDATYIALPLFIALLIVKSWLGRRRIYAAGALAAGLAAGWGFWVVEAFVNFGGPLQRMREASASTTGTSPHFAVPTTGATNLLRRTEPAGRRSRLGERVVGRLSPRIPICLGHDGRDHVDQLGEVRGDHSVRVTHQGDEQATDDNGVGDAVALLEQGWPNRPALCHRAHGL